MTFPSPPSAPLVQTERDGPVFTIRLRREHKRNAVDRHLADAMDAAFNELDDDPTLLVGVLTGGDIAFCAGSDLASRGNYDTERGGQYGIIRRRRKKPLIAAVEGLALGGGMEIVLACDMVVAAEDAIFGLPEVCRGVLPTCGALFRAIYALPPNIARELVLTGEPMSAERVSRMGLVNVITPKGGSLEAALKMARRISANAPLSVQACLGAMNGLLAANDEAGWQATRAAYQSIIDSHDTKEGVQAFFEKRPPQWQGR